MVKNTHALTGLANNAKFHFIIFYIENGCFKKMNLTSGKKLTPFWEVKTTALYYQTVIQYMYILVSEESKVLITCSDRGEVCEVTCI